MAALLVGMSIMAVMMTVAMPVWRQMVQREKEEELVFRGKQYARAVGLFSRKYANTNPPSIDVLVQQRFLRKKYKDPITQDDFLPLLAGQNVPGQTPQAGSPGGRAGAGQPAAGGAAQQPGRPLVTSPIGTPAAGATGGIIGVASKSKEKSIRIYNGRTHYNEWAFVYIPPVQAPGTGAPGTAVPGQRGRQGQPVGTGPGGPGRSGTPGGGRNPNAPPNPGGRPSGIGPFQPVPPVPVGPGGR